MSRRLTEALEDAVPPNAAGARQRARGVVLAAHAERTRTGTPRRQRLSAVAPVMAVLVLALGGGAVAAAPPADELRAWVRDVVGATSPPPRPAPGLDRLPGAGRLLVTSPGGAWVVSRGGVRRRLGPYTQATWSPRGLFVAGVRGRQLTALEPGGTVRWTLGAPAPVRDPAWAPSGFRIAYRSGTTLRVVAGDGSSDRLLAARVAPIAPAWRPAGARNELTYIDPAGRVTRVDVDRGRVLSRLRPAGLGGRPRGLEWSASGARLLVTGPRAAVLMTRAGVVTRRFTDFGGAAISAAALRPDARSVALLTRTPSGRRAVLVATPGQRRPRTLFATSDSVASVTWSPDGRYVLAPWPGADQWVFLGTRAGARTRTVADVATQFDVGRDQPRGAPKIDGWCCG